MEEFIMRLARVFSGLLLLVPTLVLAQAQGRIKGKIVDTQDAGIPNAKITITCPEITNYLRELKTDDKGAFATIIADGTRKYKFKIEADGYMSVEALEKPLIGGQTLELKYTLTSVQELQKKADQEAAEAPGIKQQREGAALLEQGKKAEAKAKFAEAVAARPDLHLSWLELGKLELADGNNDAAIAAAEECLKTSLNFSPCLALGLNAARAKGDKALIQRFESAYKMANPSDPSIYYNEAVGFLNKGD
ncbi:MAG: carboxypeptidase regulatory-like domain-containing protein, partial [Acidobacteria bacterium]|nr:carboxypeptidase regulatory-like domain-containing protein [Acidobacteriota bacterium]